MTKTKSIHSTIDYSLLCPLQMRAVLLILFAGIRHDLRILARDGQRHGPRLGKKLGILERDRPFDGVIVHLLKPLDQMQLVAVLVARRIEPGAIVHADGVHDQRVSLPVPDRVAEPGWVYVLGMAAPVGMNDAEGVLVLEKIVKTAGVCTT